MMWLEKTLTMRIFDRRLNMNNTYLCHYGRKGMKWGQHIFGQDDLKSRYEKARSKLNKTKYAYSGVKGFVYKNRLKKAQSLRNNLIQEHEQIIEQGASSGKFVDKNGSINSLGCLMCGFLKTPKGVVYDNFNADQIVQDAWFNYRNKRTENVSSSSISAMYKRFKHKDLKSLLIDSSKEWTRLTRSGLILSDEYFTTVEFVQRCEELRYLARDNHLENMTVTEDMIRNAYELSFEEMHKQI